MMAVMYFVIAAAGTLTLILKTATDEPTTSVDHM
jgi:hypothetical protein